MSRLGGTGAVAQLIADIPMSVEVKINPCILQDDHIFMFM